MGRPKIRNRKRRTICLRLTENQYDILQRYMDTKSFNNEVDALRHIIDNMEKWLDKQSAPGSVRQSMQTTSDADGIRIERHPM